MRNLKALGLGLVAALAMNSAIAATAAADLFRAEQYPAQVTGDQDGQIDQLTTTAGALTCEEIKYVGTFNAASTEATLTPSYGKCKMAGLPSIVDVNGCSYKLTQTTAGAEPTTSRVDILCPAGQEITVTVNENGPPNTLTTKCIIHIPPQNELIHINWTNIGTTTTREITGHITISNLTYRHTAGSGPGACTTGHAANGSYTGKIRITGEDPTTKSHIGVFLS